MTLLEKIMNLTKTLLKEIAENTDLRDKTVGDRVIVWDGSWNEDLNGQHLYGLDVINHECIVVADNQLYTIEVEGCLMADEDGFLHRPTRNLDLIVWSPKLKVKFRTSSDCVKLLDHESIQKIHSNQS